MVELIFLALILVLGNLSLSDKVLAWVIAATLGESDETDIASESH
jgi:hypothetical protein